MSDSKIIEKIDPSIENELKSPPNDDKIHKISRESLKQEAKKRASKRSVLQKIASVIKREEVPYRELIINSEPLEKRVALLEDGMLDKFEIERPDEERMVGAIFKGKIQNLEPGLKAAFVDINQPKNAFLHYWDIIPDASADSSIEIVRENRSAEQKKRSAKVSINEIPKHFPIGTDIIIQITKDQIGSKGPRTTTNIAIPGRYLVLMPNAGQCGISRKIEDRKERDRLKEILRSLTIPEGMGVIIRTAGEGKKARFFVRDFHILLKKWRSIQEKIENSDGPCMLYQEPDLIERTVRDFLTEEVERVLVDDEEDHERIRNLVADISPRSKNKVALFAEDIPIFERFNIERQIEQTFDRNVPLPSGGEIVIEETEALVAIDVNTGSHRGKSKDGKDFIVNCNIEAAKEAARQIRLRNIGGLLILDFIDMKNKRDRQSVLNTMRDCLSGDKAKSHVLPISQLGIMQMTRQRHSESKSSGLYIPCPYSNGRGVVKSPRTMSIEIQRRIVSICKHNLRDHEDETLELLVLLHPDNLHRLKNEDRQHLLEIEHIYNCRLSFRSDITYHIENFKVLNAKTGNEAR